MDHTWLTLLSLAVTILIPSLGWVLLKLDKLNDLHTRMAVLETRPHVDPIEYTRLIAGLTSAVTALTTQVASLAATTERQFDNHARSTNKQFDILEKQLADLKKQIEVVAESLQPA